VTELGLTEMPPATGYQLWWVSGHWEAQILGDIAGVDMSQSREFPHPEALYKELLGKTTGSSVSAHTVLIALTAPLLELFFAGASTLPNGVGVLNLVWPRPSQQSAWLHLLAQASLVVECRAAVRAFFQGLGFKAEWPRAKKHHLVFYQLEAPTLLLALESGVAETQLATAAFSLNPDCYDAILRLDAELQLLDPLIWLEEKFRSHGSWLWLNPLTPASDLKGHAIVAWAEQRGVNLRLLSNPPEGFWWRRFIK
jgi:hypothetical protein